MNLFRIPLFLLMLSAFLIRLNAQQVCKADISVGVVDSNGQSFRGLTAESFAAHGEKGAVTVKAATYDDGPRRIVFVVDTSNKLSPNLHKMEAEMVKTLAAAARPEDSVGFMPAGGPGKIVKFTDDRSAIMDALDANGDAGKDRGVLDAVMDSIEWFADSRPGDSIILIAASTEHNHKTNANALAKALAAHHIRLFGLAMGPVRSRNMEKESVTTSTISQGLSYTQELGRFSDAGDEDFYPLTTNSGGVVVNALHQHSQKGGDNMEDASVKQYVRSRALIVANTIHALYRMQIDQPKNSRPAGWSLEIKDYIIKSSPAMYVLYDHELGPC